MERADPDTAAVALPDPGPRPGYPQAHLWRPLAFEQWQVELAADGRLGLDAAAEWKPSDVVFGGSLGLLDELQAGVLLDLRAAPEPGAAERVAHALELEATYAVFTSGAQHLALAGSIWFWITLREDPALVLAPTVFGVWRVVDMFGFRAALSVPVRLQIKQDEQIWVEIPGAFSTALRFDAGADTALLFVLRPEFQPLDWLWVAVGAGVAARGTDDVVVPLDFELGLTPWGPIDVFANFAFPDLQSIGTDKRTLTVGLRGRI
ncbi:MAG: hypothetical protein HY907_07085 [Deltaproteobacteria bacterium]|nr:hypothetical protein [Deltaproteobacteria bacterium]